LGGLTYDKGREKLKQLLKRGNCSKETRCGDHIEGHNKGSSGKETAFSSVRDKQVFSFLSVFHFRILQVLFFKKSNMKINEIY
jgi:hypothetical protein